jgi:hypothetical protein
MNIPKFGIDILFVWCFSVYITCKETLYHITKDSHRDTRWMKPWLNIWVIWTLPENVFH